MYFLYYLCTKIFFAGFCIRQEVDREKKKKEPEGDREEDKEKGEEYTSF